jgi:hypothetical protein
MNATDRDAKGRTATGERHGRAKLTEANVSAIRDAYPRVSGCDLAAQFGVTPSVISMIVNGKRWRDTPSH